MAIAIKSIPPLKGECAKQFIERANEASLKRGTVDFSKQAKSASAILKKAKL